MNKFSFLDELLQLSVAVVGVKERVLIIVLFSGIGACRQEVSGECDQMV